jgi:hypothetical protein
MPAPMRWPHRMRGLRCGRWSPRERAGGPAVTAAEVIAVTGRSRSRRRAYELLRDARAEEG